MVYSSILQEVMSEASAAMAVYPSERISNAEEIATLHGDHSFTTTTTNDINYLEERGRNIFFSLRMTSANHLPRLQREIIRLMYDCELLTEMAWRDNMNYRERCTCLSSIDHLSDLAELMLQAAIEYVAKEQLTQNVMPTTLSEYNNIVEKIHDFREIMSCYRESTLESVDMAGRELSRSRCHDSGRGRQEQEQQQQEEGLCLICCSNDPVGSVVDSCFSVVCSSCKNGFTDSVCWSCTQELFNNDHYNSDNIGRCPFCRKKLTFENVWESSPPCAHS